MMHTRYKIRSALVFLLLCTLYIIIVSNLYLIQIRRTDFFKQLGEKQYTVTMTCHPPRAAIYDRTGQLLAMNKDSIAAFILPKRITHKEKLVAFLSTHFPQTLQRLATTKSHFMYVCRRLTDEQVQLIQNSGIEDIYLLQEPHRYYPVPCAGHIIGITDIDNKGLFGFELFLNKQLAGSPTTYVLERDARSGRFYFQRRTTIEGNNGSPVQLTIDSDLQFLVYEELRKTIATLQAREGAAIIINPHNGDILAMVMYPDFDPNNTQQLSLEFTKNKLITEEYELGSVIKVFATMAALEEGVVHMDELIDCEQVKTTYIDGRKINTVPSSVVGVVPFSTVIEKSNNIGIAKVVKRLGPTLYDHYFRIGFGKKTGVEFPGERSGFVNPPENWSKQSLFSLSYGYEITATLLQLAKAFCVIAHNGYDVQPRLIIHNKPSAEKTLLYSPQTIATIEQILERTVTQGSAKRALIKGYRMMSKTGTANLLINGQYSTDHNIYTCAGIVEKGSYKRVIITFVRECPQKNLYASTVAVPLLEKITSKTLIHDKIV